jgi:hypothetical protein
LPSADDEGQSFGRKDETLDKFNNQKGDKRPKQKRSHKNPEHN